MHIHRYTCIYIGMHTYTFRYIQIQTITCIYRLQISVNVRICIYIYIFHFFLLSGQDKKMPALRGNPSSEMYWQKAVQNDAKRHLRFQVSNTRLHSKRGWTLLLRTYTAKYESYTAYISAIQYMICTSMYICIIYVRINDTYTSIIKSSPSVARFSTGSSAPASPSSPWLFSHVWESKRQKGFCFISNRQRRGKKARNVRQGEVGFEPRTFG